MKETLRRLLPKQNITLTDGQLDTLARFGQALLEKNQVMNLTAITEPEKVAELHFYDCLALLNAADFRGKRVVDIGCGAGFPGVPLKIAEPSMDLTLLDSLGKRMDWLREVLPELHVEANVVTARASQEASDPSRALRFLRERPGSPRRSRYRPRACPESPPRSKARDSRKNGAPRPYRAL